MCRVVRMKLHLINRWDDSGLAENSFCFQHVEVRQTLDRWSETQIVIGRRETGLAHRWNEPCQSRRAFPWQPMFRGTVWRDRSLSQADRGRVSVEPSRGAGCGTFPFPLGCLMVALFFPALYAWGTAYVQHLLVGRFSLRLTYNA